jgi:hypothetical protein
VVPGTRGKEQSRDPDAIKREVLALGEAGYKEVTLLGQNIDAYGRDLPGFAADDSGRRLWTFSDLLRHVHGAPGIERIRFATSHPRYFTKRLIKTLHELPQVCEYFHIPFQSGNDEILRQMKRGYSMKRYRVNIVSEKYHIKPLEKNYNSEVAKRWSYQGGEFGVISSISNPFCGDCSRIRLTAEGKLFTCLFANKSHDIKSLIRSSESDDKIKNYLIDMWSDRDDKYSETRIVDGKHKVIKKAEMSYIGG